MADGHSFIYVDDSGNEIIGASMTALIIPSERWSECLGYWMQLRRELESDYKLPSHFEIHSNAFLSAHPLKDVQAAARQQSKILSSRLDDPVLDSVAIAKAQVELADIALNAALAAAVASDKDPQAISSASRLNKPDVADRLQRSRSMKEFEDISCLGSNGKARATRRTAYQRLLDQIASFPGTRVLTVCADDGDKGTMGRVYAHLLAILEDFLAAEKRWGTVIVDGTPSARTQYYRDAHRDLTLAERRILEDEVLRDSSESHFIQMADICAHSAFDLRQKEPARYMRLARVIHNANDEKLDADNPGFFALPEPQK